MTDLEYHAHPAMGREQLLLLADSPELFHAVESGAVSRAEARQLLDSTSPPRSKSDVFAIGEGVHRMVFEPDTVEWRFQVIDPRVLTANGQRRGKSWERYEAHWRERGKVLVTATQLALIKAVSKAVKPIIEQLTADDAILEQPLFWDEVVTVDGEPFTIPCRGKPDYLLVRPGLGLCMDLKTCNDPRKFQYDAERWRLWMQAVHYMAGVKAKYGIVPRWYWIAVSKTFPFRVRVKEMDEKSHADAWDRRQQLLEEYVERTRSGDWSDPVDADIETLHVQVN